MLLMYRFGTLNTLLWANLKNICFPLPGPVLLVWVGRSKNYFISQIRYPLNLIVNSPTIGNKIKNTNNLLTKNIFSRLHCRTILQVCKLANELKKKS